MVNLLGTICTTFFIRIGRVLWKIWQKHFGVCLFTVYTEISNCSRSQLHCSYFIASLMLATLSCCVDHVSVQGQSSKKITINLKKILSSVAVGCNRLIARGRSISFQPSLRPTHFIVFVYRRETWPRRALACKDSRIQVLCSIVWVSFSFTIFYICTTVMKLLSVQCNACHWTDIKSLECMSVCLSACLSVRNTVEIPIMHDSDRSFCPIFLKFGM